MRQVGTYRPRELERQADESFVGSVKIERVVAEHGCHEVAVRARSRQVDARLIVLQAHSEHGATRLAALVRLAEPRTAAAVAFGVAAEAVDELG